jgi:glutaconate CoA-transferase subunit B
VSSSLGPNIVTSHQPTFNEPVIEEFQLITDQRATRWAEAYYLHNDLVENMKFRRKGVFFAGALQIDRYGNSNLIGIGADYRALKFRGPGAIGVCNATVMNNRFLVVNCTTSASFTEVRLCRPTGTGGRCTSSVPGGGPRGHAALRDGFPDETKACGCDRCIPA